MSRRGASDEPARRSCAVLVADDTPGLGELLAAWFAADDRFAVIGTAAGDEEILALAADRRPDVVVLDWFMPGNEDGAIIDRLRRELPGVAVVVISGDDRAEAEAQAAGAAAFVRKGSSPARLSTTVWEAAQRPATAASSPTAERPRPPDAENAPLQAREIIHALRAPLTSAKVFAAMLPEVIERRESLQVRTALRSIQASMERLDILITTMATDAAIRSDSLRLQPTVLDLAALAASTTAELGPLLERHDASVESPGQVSVVADEARMRECVANLLVNAATFAPPGSSIHVAVAHHDGVPTLSVTDRGPGIPPQQRDAVFERGVTLSRLGAGLGLGLFVSRELVRAHGGTLTLEDSEPDGTRFALRLPKDTSWSNV